MDQPGDRPWGWGMDAFAHPPRAGARSYCRGPEARPRHLVRPPFSRNPHRRARTTGGTPHPVDCLAQRCLYCRAVAPETGAAKLGTAAPRMIRSSRRLRPRLPAGGCRVPVLPLAGAWRANGVEDNLGPLAVADRSVEIPLEPHRYWTVRFDVRNWAGRCLTLAARQAACSHRRIGPACFWQGGRV
jgi:hypothetical protein